VIVNKFNPRATDVSIERVFFELLTVYRASVQASSGVYRTLRLVPPSPNAIVNAVRELSVVVHATTLAVTSITATTDAGQFSFAITQLKINAPVPAATFTYKAPTGWEVIDLR
jgi:outer membrane lipoprotein-sorting protein